MSCPPPLSVPRRDRGPLLVLLAGCVAAVGFLVLALSGGDERPAPPPTQVAVQLPAAPAPVPPAPVLTEPAAAEQTQAPEQARTAKAEALDARRFAANDRSHVRADWVAGFYPLYERSAETHGITWLLLASIHKQETGFSTHETTYKGLNFANCCGGPMQFNVTNGPVSTWERFQDAYRAAERPTGYNHATDEHPSIYDDFDAIMAAGALLRTSGATTTLDGSAWRAAYDYYGHDLAGVDYASQVTARAIGWARNGFCINCATDPGLLAQVDGAWGAPVRTALLEADERARKPAPGPKATAASK